MKGFTRDFGEIRSLVLLAVVALLSSSLVCCEAQQELLGPDYAGFTEGGALQLPEAPVER